MSWKNVEPSFSGSSLILTGMIEIGVCDGAVRTKKGKNKEMSYEYAVVAMGEEGDMVVVAGKGHEVYQLEGDKKEFYDDREECLEALQYVDELHQAGIDTCEFPWRLPESH
ncbi:unnamed protein product [Arabis nemorensis]|uniref:Uncharacterized protein n=1 Tax=Arabis nemorensis TaxID=586526 RepID=A0A565AS81_9BRAS|nr:unnamed protein product [Arabis nemorensis]